MQHEFAEMPNGVLKFEGDKNQLFLSLSILENEFTQAANVATDWKIEN